VSHYNPGAHP
jgi:hypothetical protein